MCHINRRRITADGDTSMGTTKFQEFESFVYIDEDFPAKNVSELEQNTIEPICIEYTVNKKKNLLCFTYKAPDLDILKCLVGIENILLKTSDYNDIIFMGDFNCKHVSFCPTDMTTPDGKAIKAFFDSKDFTQLIHKPTRFQNICWRTTRKQYACWLS